MSKRDYYEVLGVARDATPDEIKRAYRKLAMQHHPDQNDSDDDAAFKEAGEAYGVLSDPDQRQKYDQFGHDGPNMNWSGQAGFSDIFSSFFGGFRQQERQRGSDIQTTVTLTLEEVARGAEKHVVLHRHNHCASCQGIGGSGKACSTCKGNGRINQQHGPFQSSRTCHKCHGKKLQITSPCQKCGGAGRRQETHTVSIQIPPGVDDGETLIIRGEGNGDRPSRPRGDCRLHVSVLRHPKFQRDGYHLVHDKALRFSDLCLGTKCKIETLLGETVELTIPAGTQFGQVFRLSGHGLRLRQQKGDLFVRIRVNVPKNIPTKAASLIKDFDQHVQYNDD